MRALTRKTGLKRRTSGTLAVLLVLDGFLSALAPFPAVPAAQAIIANGMPAVDEIGAYNPGIANRMVPDFTRDNLNGGANAFGLSQGGYGIEFDAVHHRLFVPDIGNRRVLVYNLKADNTLDDRLPDHVIGQRDFNTSDTVTVSQTVLGSVYGMAYDATNDRLFVPDRDNHRVMVFDLSAGITDGMAASHVLGQPNFTSSILNATTDGLDCLGVSGSTNACGLGFPSELEYDFINQRLFVSDLVNTGTQRVTVFDVSSITDGEPAVKVLGQPDFTHNSINNITPGQTCLASAGSTNACGTRNPAGLAFDAANQRLFVSETLNNRVVVYNVSGNFVNGEAAAKVLGQPDFIHLTQNNVTAGQTCLASAGSTNSCGLYRIRLGQPAPFRDRQRQQPHRRLRRFSDVGEWPRGRLRPRPARPRFEHGNGDTIAHARA